MLRYAYWLLGDMIEMEALSEGRTCLRKTYQVSSMTNALTLCRYSAQDKLARPLSREEEVHTLAADLAGPYASFW